MKWVENVPTWRRPSPLLQVWARVWLAVGHWLSSLEAEGEAVALGGREAEEEMEEVTL